MRRVLIFLLFSTAVTGAHAGPLACRMDKNTREAICYERASIRANGNLRSFTMATGGPKGVDKLPYLGVVACPLKYLEIRNKRGVVISREIPKKETVRYLIEDLCRETKVKLDKTLD